MHNAELYRSRKGLQKNDSVYVIKNFLKYIKWKSAKNTILDVGSGDGHTLCEILLPKISTKINKTIGIDIAEEMITFAGREYGNDNTSFEEMDIATVNIPVEFYGKFDVIFSFFCLHWVLKHSLAYSNIYEMLKPGGTIFFTYLAKNPIYEIYEEMSKIEKWRPYMTNYKEYISPFHLSSDPAQELRELIEKVGFHVELCRAEKRSYTFPNEKILKDSARAVNPFLSKIPEEKHPEYFNDYSRIMRELNTVKIIKNNNNNDEETIECFYHLFIVIASKSD